MLKWETGKRSGMRTLVATTTGTLQPMKCLGSCHTIWLIRCKTWHSILTGGIALFRDLCSFSCCLLLEIRNMRLNRIVFLFLSVVQQIDCAFCFCRSTNVNGNGTTHRSYYKEETSAPVAAPTTDKETKAKVIFMIIQQQFSLPSG